MNERLVYLDYAATTPVDPQVRDAMLPYLSEAFGNPSSVHRAGQDVRRAIDNARDVIASEIGADPSEIYFTSGGTEADNTALAGVLAGLEGTGRTQLVTSVIEHHAVLDMAKWLATRPPNRVSWIDVDREGKIDPAEIAQAVGPETALVSIMHANNEIGTMQDIRRIAERTHAAGAYVHTDAVQTFGQMPLKVDTLSVDLMTLSSHKIYGPKGVGALYVRRGVPWHPFLHGGQQEREKRAGTENVPGIIGFGKAVELLPTWRDAEAARLTALRDRFIAMVQKRIPGATLNGSPTDRLPNNVNLSFPRVDGETLLLALDMAGIAASSGSACASGSIEPSHVIASLGLSQEYVRSAVRFSLGRSTTEADLEYTGDVLERIVC